MPETVVVPLVNSLEFTKATSQVVAEVVQQVVNHPKRVVMLTQTYGRTLKLMLTVAPDDLGKIIRKQGRTARSPRILLSSISSKTGLDFEVNIDTERDMKPYPKSARAHEIIDCAGRP